MVDEDGAGRLGEESLISGESLGDRGRGVARVDGPGSPPAPPPAAAPVLAPAKVVLVVLLLVEVEVLVFCGSCLPGPGPGLFLLPGFSSLLLLLQLHLLVSSCLLQLLPGLQHSQCLLP